MFRVLRPYDRIHLGCGDLKNQGTVFGVERNLHLDLGIY